MNPQEFAPPKENPHGKKNLIQKLLILLAKIPAAVIALKNRFLSKGLPLSGLAKGLMAKLESVTSGILSPLIQRLPEGLRASVRKMIPIISLVIVAAVLGLGVKKIMTKPKPAETLEKAVSDQKEGKETLSAVKGFKVGRFNFEDSLNALGTLKGAIEFKLSFEVPGLVSSINYREGERYEEGALLMSLRQDDILLRLKRAQAALKKSETDVKLAQDKLEEHETLFSIGAIPESTIKKVKLEADSAKYEAEAARLEMKAQEAILEKSNLYAPSAGMIGELNVEEGESVTPNTLLGTHIMTEYVYAEFGVVERDVSKIALGQKAKVFIDAYPDKTFEGVIENVSPVVAGTSRTATAKVRVENPERLLLPGMFARVRVLLYSKKNTLVVPADALQGAEGEQFVFVINTEKSTVEKRPITIGYKRPDYCQVDAGISEGEVIAISNLEKLEDGVKIRLLETQEADM